MTSSPAADLASVLAGRFEREVCDILARFADASAELRDALATAPLSNLLGATGDVNVQGESTQKLDDRANEIFKAALSLSSVARLISEEEDEPIEVGDGRYTLGFDPLDGSSNIGFASVGSVLGVYDGVARNSFDAGGMTGRSLSWDQLEQRLLELARAQGRAEAIVIIRVHGGETATSSYDFQVFKGEPAEVWALDAETGERRRLRDVELIGTPLAAMQRVVAFGGDPQVDEGYCYAESGSIPVSGACPALLLSEIELQQRSSTGFHEPLLPPPFADDGSRGRTMDERKRGRRRKR